MTEINPNKLDSKGLELLFQSGKRVSAAHIFFNGGGYVNHWRVKMLTGPIPNMGGPIFRHRKMFARIGPGEEDIVWCNILFNNFRWGNFMVGPYPLEDGTTVINYHIAGNNSIISRIRDHIRTTDNPNVLIGKFHVIWRNRERFLGYFTLTKEEEHMRTTPYLVQRLHSRPKPKSEDLVGHFEFEWMGAAEFEWGQPQSSLCEMRSEGLHDPNKFKLIEIKFDGLGMTRVDHGPSVAPADMDSIHSIFFLGPESRLHLAQGLIHRAMTDAESEFGTDRLKERTFMKGAYATKCTAPTNAWWCIDKKMGFLLFKDRDDATRFLKADAVSSIPCPDDDRR